MTVWNLLNAFLSVGIFGIIAYKLLVRRRNFNAYECLGMGLTAAGCIMTVGPILWRDESPFENWAATLMRFGLMVYFIGRMMRK